MALVTIRVPERLKKEMRKVKSINWSALLRDAIETRLELERWTTQRDQERLRRASKEADSVREEIAREYGHIEFNSAETIRHWREMRSHGTSRMPQ
jgi:hypothetical protein